MTERDALKVDFYHEEVVNGLSRVQMADQPPKVNDQVVLCEQVGRVSSAGQDLLSAHRQSASSLNGVLILARQIRHLILRENESDGEDESAGRLCIGKKKKRYIDQEPGIFVRLQNYLKLI